jgi:drug/metabolite transporter (DMT)-like permease
VPVSAFLLAFAAAWLHGTGNVLLGGRTREPEAATAMMLVIGVVAFAPVAALTWRVDASAWPYILVSAAFELVYFALLAAAYRRSEVSLVYPVARGSAPVLVLLGTLVIFGRGVGTWQVLGVIAVAAGIVLVRGVQVGGDRRGLALALATGACIAGYTLVDKEGLHHAGPIPYIELVLIPPALLYALAIARVRGREALRTETTPLLIAISLVLYGTYVLVLLALRLAPAPAVSAVRETSVVIASGLALVLLHERVTRVRFAGAVLVAAGIALLALAG